MHPHISARKKIRKHTSLKESRKRKFTNVREGRAVKKSKRKRTNV